MKRFTFGFYIFLSVSILLECFWLIQQKEWASLGMSLLTLIFLALPFLIEKRFNLEFPRGFLSVFLLFLYAAIFLGTANHFYVRFWWWDKMLHGVSGVIFANLGFLIGKQLNPGILSPAKSSRIFISLYSFCFSVASGAVWEIYEYTMDQTFGFLYQGVGIYDTMTDIIADTLGALAFGIYFYFRGTKGSPRK